MPEHIIVTGANRGIGLEFVKQLAARGTHVTATARDPEGAKDLNALAKEHGDSVRVMPLDIADMDSVRAFIKALDGKPIDQLINNAGIYPDSGKLGALDWESATQGFEVNTIAPLRLTEALLHNLKNAMGKKVMFVTSQMGSIDDNTSGGSYAYRMSKAALNMGVRSLSHDLRDADMIAFVIHPGWVQTDMGGPNAKITPTQSVEGMLSVLDSATADISGKFMNWDGSRLAW